MIEEQKLVTRVLSGDPAAEEAFFKMFYPRLYKAALYFLGGQDSDAEDIVQDTFMIALPKLKDYDFCAPIFAWLRQICLRLCYARLRNRNRVLMTLDEDLEVHMESRALESMERDELFVQKQVKIEILTRLKEQLSPYSRGIIEMRDMQGMTYAEIGRNLGIPIGTVMSRLARSRDQLRNMLQSIPEAEMENSHP